MEITKTETYKFDGDIIELQYSDTDQHFAMRMVVNGTPGDWRHHHAGAGGSARDLICERDYIWFSEYWTGYVPVNRVFRLADCVRT